MSWVQFFITRNGKEEHKAFHPDKNDDFGQVFCSIRIDGEDMGNPKIVISYLNIGGWEFVNEQFYVAKKKRWKWKLWRSK